MKSLVVAALLILASAQAHALVVGGPAAPISSGYYVATAGGGGSDSNPGTLSQPFLTLGKCQTTMRSGDKICYIRAGTYALPSGGLSLTASDASTTYQYYPPDGVNTAILDGTAPSGASTFMIQTATGATGVTFNGLKLINTNYIFAFIQGNNSNWVNNIIDGTGKTGAFYGLDIYGNNMLVAGNTIQNLNNSSSGAGARAIQLNSTGFTNSVIKNNTFQCDTNYGIWSDGNATGNIIYNNQILGIGHTGGAAPACGTQIDPSGTGINLLSASTGNLIAGNAIQDVEGYTIVVSAANNEYISDNTLQTNSDPAITLNGSSNTIIRRNAVQSPGSIGFNLGDEHDTCPATARSDNLYVTNNTFSFVSTSYEAIWLSGTTGSIIQGNISTNAGNILHVSFAQHYPAAISFINKSFDEGCTCPAQCNGGSYSNTVQDNNFQNSISGGKYGAYLEAQGGSGQSLADNTISHNILYPFGSSGTVAISDNTADATVTTDNQTSGITTVSAAPPRTDAGFSQISGAGQTVTLDGTATTNFPSGTTSGITYSWSQISGTTVTIANPTSATASFMTPSIPLVQAAILVFQLTATNANGSSSDRVMVGLDPSFSGSSTALLTDASGNLLTDASGALLTQ